MILCVENKRRMWQMMLHGLLLCQINGVVFKVGKLRLRRFPLPVEKLKNSLCANGFVVVENFVDIVYNLL